MGEPGERRRAVEPSEARNSGAGAARLDQATKASMSTRPAILATTLPAPQNAAAAMTSSNGPRLAPPSRSEPISAMPAKAIAAPSPCAGFGRSPRNAQASKMVKNACNWMTSEARPTGKPSRTRDEQQAELADADEQAVEDDERRRRLRRADEQDQRQRGEDEAQRRQRQRRRFGDADLDGDEREAPDDRDGDRGQDVARRHQAARLRSCWLVRRPSRRPCGASRRSSPRSPSPRRAAASAERSEVMLRRSGGVRIAAIPVTATIA